jgi:hypothetical protein
VAVSDYEKKCLLEEVAIVLQGVAADDYDIARRALNRATYRAEEWRRFKKYEMQQQEAQKTDALN